MNSSQKQLNTIKETIDALSETINEWSNNNGQGYVINECTNFTEYPNILRNVINATNKGLATTFAYKISDTNPGKPDTSGSFSFDTNLLIAPDGWMNAESANIINNTSDTVWMSQALFSENSDHSSTLVGFGWSDPIRISTVQKIMIENQTQTVYWHEKDSPLPPTVKPEGTNEDILKPDLINSRWTKQFLGVGPNQRYVWISQRIWKNNMWTPYSEPVLYAYYALDGIQGADAILNRTVFAFKITDKSVTDIASPKGGSWNHINNIVEYPVDSDGVWLADAGEVSKNQKVWMSTTTFTSDSNKDPEWSKPTCITGSDGEPGKDGESVEFVYARLPKSTDLELFKNYCTQNNITIRTNDGNTAFIKNGSETTELRIPRSDGSNFIVRLTDSPNGITVEQQVEIYWVRQFNNNVWSAWSGPMFWAVWGEKGLDGDGVQYVYAVSSNNSAPIRILKYEELSESDKKLFQTDEYVPNGWVDDPSDFDIPFGQDMPYLFCALRKKTHTKDNQMMWGDYSEPQIWSHWGKDGSGSFTSFAFCIANKILDLSKCTVHGGYYTDPLANLTTYDSGNVEMPNIVWTDTIEKTPTSLETVWMITKFFSDPDDSILTQWSKPTKLADSPLFEVEYCSKDYDGRELISLEAFKELSGATYTDRTELILAWEDYVSNNGFGKWTQDAKDAVYMATASLTDSKWSNWSVNKIKGESGNSTQFIFTLTDGKDPVLLMPDNPADEIYQTDNYCPDNWTPTPPSVTDTLPVCWISQRTKTNDVWSWYSSPSKFAMYAQGQIRFELSDYNINLPVDSQGKIENNFSDIIAIKLYLYDNATLKNEDVTYTAIVNGSKDMTISKVLSDEPLEILETGFYNSTLYITKSFLDTHYQNDDSLRIECIATYNDIPYTRSIHINKSTSTYELWLSQKVLPVDNNKKFKDEYLQVQVWKWQGDFQIQSDGYVRCDCTLNDGTEIIGTPSTIDAGGIEYISLNNYMDVKEIKISYSKKLDPWETLTWEIIGTVSDGADGKDGKDGVNSAVNAFVFTRNSESLNHSNYIPTGGSYFDPIPTDASNTGIIWSDSIPTGSDPIWMSQRTFYADESRITTWSIPTLMSDSSEIDIEWSTSETLPASDPPSYEWTNDATNAIWMAVRTKSAGVWSSWKKSKIKGEKGDKGDSISSIIEYYAKHTSKDTPPEEGWTNLYTVELDSTYKYLWNYEEIFINGISFFKSTPQVISTYVEDGSEGRGIAKIIDYYALSDDENRIPTEWNPSILKMDSINRYLWNYEEIQYTDGTTEETDKLIIGVYGDTGERGEKGEKGEDGESIQGSAGAMIRMSDWTLTPKSTYIDDNIDGFYQSGDTTKWYDVVTHNNSKYRCIVSHTPIANTEPGIGEDWETYWIEANEFEFVATKLLLSEKINADQIDVDNITVQSLNTRDTNETTSQPWVNIQKGVFDLYSSDGKKVLSLGTFGDDNKVYTGLMFYDEFGSVSYTIDGSRGLQDLSNSSSAEKTWESYQSQYSVLTSKQQKDWKKSNTYATMLVSSTFWDGIIPLVVDENNISSSETSVYKLTYYTIDTSGNRYAHTMNGYYFNTKDLSDDEFSNHLMNGAYIIKGEKEYTYYNDVPSQWYFEINQFNMHVSPVYQIPAISEMKGGIITRYPIYLYKNGQMLDPNSFVHYIYRYNEKA